MVSTAQRIHERGPKEVIITRGSKGSIISIEGEVAIQPAYMSSAANPTGAGDAYTAGYLRKRHDTEDPAVCGRYAAMTASTYLDGRFLTHGMIHRRLMKHKRRQHS